MTDESVAYLTNQGRYRNKQRTLVWNYFFNFIRGVQEGMVQLKQGFDNKSMTGYTSDFSVG